MKLSDKLKAYLVWGCIMMFFASLGQLVVCMLFNSPRYHNHSAFVILSIFNWLVFGILTHIWARDDP